MDGDGDVEDSLDWPGTRPSALHVAVAVHVNVHVNAHVNAHVRVAR